jgi:hypothetical protein
MPFLIAIITIIIKSSLKNHLFLDSKSNLLDSKKKEASKQASKQSKHQILDVCLMSPSRSFVCELFVNPKSLLAFCSSCKEFLG